MQAEIIAVGTEFLTSLRPETNSLWLCEQLEDIGIAVGSRTVVGDDLERLTTAFREAIGRGGVVLATGGLGPTLDDLTRDALSQATGRALRLDESIVWYLRRRFAARGREMTDNNRRQAMVPEGATAMPNPDGTAPGIRLEHQGTRIAVLPGPPREMKPMFNAHVRPWLADLSEGWVTARRTLHVTGIGESAMDSIIGPIYSRTDNPITTINFTPTDLELHLCARAATRIEAEERIETLVAQLAPALGDKLYSTAGEPLEVVVGRRLAATGLALATAESLTGGLIAERITRVPGASGYFRGGLLTYTDELKQRLLGVPPALLQQHGAVSAPVAEAMATGARERAGADLAVSATGYAGPGGGTTADPVGTVYLGLADATGCRVLRLELLGDRELVRLRASQAALFELLRRFLT